MPICGLTQLITALWFGAKGIGGLINKLMSSALIGWFPARYHPGSHNSNMWNRLLQLWEVNQEVFRQTTLHVSTWIWGFRLCMPIVILPGLELDWCFVNVGSVHINVLGLLHNHLGILNWLILAPLTMSMKHTVPSPKVYLNSTRVAASEVWLLC